MYTYYVDMSRNPDFDEDLYLAWEQGLEDATIKFSEESTYFKVTMLTMNGIKVAYDADSKSDTALIPLAISVIGVYICLTLGSWSPIHCRILVGLGGVLTIILAYCAGFGAMFYLDG